MNAPLPRRCPVRFLIDGYNLMHAAGYLTARPKPGRLEPVRTRFRNAANAPGYSPESAHRGAVFVRFAYRQTADDLIESDLAGDAEPGSLVVVSNDGRLHEAARRRRVRAWSCERFVDWVVSAEPTPAPAEPPTPEKPDAVPADEAAELLKAFEARKPR